MSSFWHLAIECSGLGGSVALLDCSRPPAQHLRLQRLLPQGHGSVQTLAPAIAELLLGVEVAPSQLRLISVTHGPGSFTGLRVGLTTAKLLSWAHNIPVVQVDTLAATALRFAQSEVARSALANAPAVRVVAAINAFRQQVFSCCSWLSPAGQLQVAQLSCVCQADAWRAAPWRAAPWLVADEGDSWQWSARAGGAVASDAVGFSQSAPLWVTGTALEIYPLQAEAEANLAPAELWQPLAEHVAVLGWQQWLAGAAVTAAQVSPNYLRASAAEDKASGRN